MCSVALIFTSNLCIMFYKWLAFALFLTLTSCENTGLSDEHRLAIWTDHPGSTTLYINGQPQGILRVYATEIDCQDSLMLTFSFAEGQDYLLAIAEGAGIVESALLRFHPSNTGLQLQLYNDCTVEISDRTGAACDQLLLSW